MSTWTTPTGAEKDFLNRIGTWRQPTSDSERLLRAYRKAMLLRQNWGGIDRNAIADHIKRLLRERV